MNVILATTKQEASLLYKLTLIVLKVFTSKSKTWIVHDYEFRLCTLRIRQICILSAGISLWCLKKRLEVWLVVCCEPVCSN